MGLLDSLLAGVGSAADTGANLLGNQIQQETAFQNALKMLDEKMSREIKAKEAERTRSGQAFSEIQSAAKSGLDADRKAYVAEALGISPDQVTPQMMEEYSPQSQAGLLSRSRDEAMRRGESVIANDLGTQYKDELTRERQDKQDARQVQRDAVSDFRDERRDAREERRIRAEAGERSLRLKTAQLQYERLVEEQKLPSSVSKAYEAERSLKEKLVVAQAKYTEDSPEWASYDKRIAEQDRKMSDLITPYLPKETGNKPTRSLDDLARGNGGGPKATTPEPAKPAPEVKPTVSATKPNYGDAEAARMSELAKTQESLNALRKIDTSSMNEAGKRSIEAKIKEFEARIKNLS